MNQVNAATVLFQFLTWLENPALLCHRDGRVDVVPGDHDGAEVGGVQVGDHWGRLNLDPGTNNH